MLKLSRMGDSSTSFNVNDTRWSCLMSCLLINMHFILTCIHTAPHNSLRVGSSLRIRDAKTTGTGSCEQSGEGGGQWDAWVLRLGPPHQRCRVEGTGYGEKAGLCGQELPQQSPGLERSAGAVPTASPGDSFPAAAQAFLRSFII